MVFAEYGLITSRKSADPCPIIDHPSLRRHAVNGDGIVRRLVERDNWLTRLMSHTQHVGGAQQLILLSHVAETLYALEPAAHFGKSPRVLNGVERLRALTDRALTMSAGKDASRSMAERFSATPYLSPYLLLYARTALARSAALITRLDASPSKASRPEKALERYFEREIDRLMARRGLNTDPGFDAPSLIFSIRGLQVCRADALVGLSEPYMHAALDSIVAAQAQDGTWPDGVSALTAQGAHTLQQPSVKIALILLSTVFTREMLTSMSPSQDRLLRRVLPALERMASFLAATYVTQTTRGAASGWASDRVKWSGTAEMWINALTARFFLHLHLAKRAIARNDHLSALGAPTYVPPVSLKQRLERWEGLVDPDDVARPLDEIKSLVINPIIEGQRSGRAIVAPGAGGVSLLIFGPPGTGKTFFVANLAQVLGWPLVELSPGAFVRGGTELIESRATEVFRMLSELEHAVVFFDECDELFRDRSGAGEATRNILSFVTASMLPKLQKLHDLGRIVFVVATNYLHRIDPAIRRPGRFDLVLLLDRPAARARQQQISRQVVAGKRRIQLQRAVAVTAGLTPKEIAEWLRAAVLAPSPSGTRADYVEWCEQEGGKELAASRLSPENRERISARWTQVRGMVPPKRPARRRPSPGRS